MLRLIVAVCIHLSLVPALATNSKLYLDVALERSACVSQLKSVFPESRYLENGSQYFFYKVTDAAVQVVQSQSFSEVEGDLPLLSKLEKVRNERWLTMVRQQDGPVGMSLYYLLVRGIDSHFYMIPLAQYDQVGPASYSRLQSELNALDLRTSPLALEVTFTQGSWEALAARMPVKIALTETGMKKYSALVYCPDEMLLSVRGILSNGVKAFSSQIIEQLFAGRVTFEGDHSRATLTEPAIRMGVKYKLGIHPLLCSTSVDK